MTTCIDAPTMSGQTGETNVPPCRARRQTCRIPLPMPKLSCLASLILFFAASNACALRADEPAREAAGNVAATPEQEAFFEKKVRPLLTARCFECHGEKKQE